MTDPRITFAKSVDLAAAVVEDFPALLFFCGGPINSASSPEPLSVRDAVLRAFALRHPNLANRIFLAEEFKDWMYDGVYNELFTFEQHLASLSSAIVIFVESAGSIAELGAFSQLLGVKDKLIVFVQTELYEQESFIKLGPIKYLEGAFPNSVRPYPWKIIEGEHSSRVDIASLDDCVEEICDAISEALGQTRVQRKFDINGIRDQMLLIRDVLGQLIGLKLHEIANCILDMGVTIETGRLRQFLFVLKTLNLIRVVPRGKDRYYVANDPRRFIRYGMKNGLPKIDWQRLQSEVSAYYKESDGPRFKALAPVLAELEG